MKKIAAGLLGSLGLEVHRTTKPGATRTRTSDPRTAGLILEMVGPSGVGKSTLRRQLYPSVQERWLSTAELYEQYDFADLSDGADPEVAGLYKELLRLHIDHICDGGTHVTIRHQVQAIEWHARNILSNLALEGPPLPFGVFKDEGILSNLAGEVFALLGAGHHGLSEAMAKRRVVYVSGTPEWILGNIKQRRVERGAESIADFPGHSDGELLQLLGNETALAAMYVDRLIEFGVPTVELRASDDLETNRDRFLAFERQILQAR